MDDESKILEILEICYDLKAQNRTLTAKVDDIASRLKCVEDRTADLEVKRLQNGHAAEIARLRDVSKVKIALLALGASLVGGGGPSAIKAALDLLVK